MLWEAWRHAPDPFLLQERVYPLLLVTTTFALEIAAAHPEALQEPKAQAQLHAALQTLLWASIHLEVDAERRPVWEEARQRLAATAPPYRSESLQPFGALPPEDAALYLRAWVEAAPLRPQGLFAAEPYSPELIRAAQMCAGLNSLLLREEGLSSELRAELRSLHHFGGGEPRALRVFPGLPPGWNASFEMIAPGGFRVCAEASEGMPRYVAIISLLGGPCRLFNPWGEGTPFRIFDGRRLLYENEEELIDFVTQPNGAYVIEHADYPLTRAVRARLSGRRNERPKTLGPHLLGLPKTE